MKSHCSYLAAFAGAAVLAMVLAPAPSSGQAETDAVTRLIGEVTKQQAAIAENQTKIDEKLAKIGEDVRQARIFAGRAGGGGKK